MMSVPMTGDGMKRLSDARPVSRRQQALLASAAEDGVLRRWAIVTVETRRDNDVDNLLSRTMIEHWLPLRKAAVNINGRRRGAPGEPIWMLAWPGYIFVKIADSAEAWQEISRVKHVRTVLGVDERPFYFDDAKLLVIKAELATLKAVTGPETMYAPGDRVQVLSGPLASFPAMVDSVEQDGPNAGRARVEVMIFGRAVPVELDIAQLAKSY